MVMNYINENQALTLTSFQYINLFPIFLSITASIYITFTDFEVTNIVYTTSHLKALKVKIACICAKKWLLDICPCGF